MVLLLGVSPLTTEARPSESGLNKRQFSRYWQVESESPDYQVTFRGDTCELLSPKGLTLWRKQPLSADMTVEYDACVVNEGKAGDRLSDLNCFWLASDPKAKDIFARASWRSGIFTRCYSLQMYYLGFGGNYNTTTRFRRYDGDEAGIQDAAKRPAILKEYTDKAHLLKSNHWYHVKIESLQGRTRFFIDGECIVDYLDPEPLTHGWFGFRTTLSRTRITGFKVSETPTLSVATTNHLFTIMGGFEVMNELLPLTGDKAFEACWLDFARRYKQMAKNHFPVRRLEAYAAWRDRDPKRTATVWDSLWKLSDRTSNTNNAALWSLDAIYIQEVLQKNMLDGTAK